MTRTPNMDADRCLPLVAGMIVDFTIIPETDRWFAVYGMICRAYRSARDSNVWLASVYNGFGYNLAGESVCGTFASARDAAIGAAVMLEGRQQGRVSSLTDIDAIRRDRKAGLI